MSTLGPPIDGERFCMKQDHSADCPPFATLTRWFDGLVESAEDERIEAHLDTCARCRQSVLEWGERVASISISQGQGRCPSPAPPAGEDDGEGTSSLGRARGGSAAGETTSPWPPPSQGGGNAAAEGATDCPDAERLLAYCGATLDTTAETLVEEHLRHCAQCVAAVQHFVRLGRQMERDEKPSAVVAAPAHAAIAARHSAGRVAIAALRAWWEQLGDLLTPRLWAGGAVAFAVLVLAIGVTRFLGPPAMQERGGAAPAMVVLTADAVGRARPAEDEVAVTRLARGTRAQQLEVTAGWTRIELVDGRKVWVRSDHVVAVRER